MKKSSIIFILIAYLFGIYYISNWFVWNWVFEGKWFGFWFLAIVAIAFSIFFTIKIKTSLIKSALIITSICIVSYFAFDISVEIGYWQTKNRLKIIKSKIDKYYLDKGFYPDEISDLKKEGYVFIFLKPIFLQSKGKYLYEQYGSSFYSLSIEAYGSGDLGFTINSRNEFSSYDY
ncbi:MAG TPA: hypothetical protein PK546_03800 [Chitinophagales bacterium]|nr:hypothetical protein [Chitinophagales bacterium]